MTKGWTEERRRKQAEAIKKWKPWEKSTGPRTEAGKARTRLNACEDHSGMELAIEANKMLRGHRIYLTHLNRIIAVLAKNSFEK